MKEEYGTMAKGIRAPSRHRVNVWVAYLMPVLIIGMVGYATYVYVALVCINHLLLAQRREPAAIVLLTLYFVFFLLLGSSYFRVVWTINANPGFVERGPQQSLYGGNEQALKEKNHSDGFDDSGSGSDLEIGLGGMRGGDAQVEEGMSLAPSSKPATATSLHNPDTASLSEALRNIPPTQDGLPAPLSPPHATENLPFSSNHSTFVHNVPDPSIAEHFHFPPPQPGNAPVQGFPYGNYGPARPAPSTAPTNLSEWYNRDAFVCESDGLPKWCGHCNCWKPDRSHHCSEVGRCVWRMDHFCPWVGGVVAETSYKFFYQVVVYGTLYCLFIIVSLAILINECLNDTGSVNANWIVTLALASLFGLFSAGMTASTTQLIYRNVSTIDSLQYSTKVYQLAIHDPNPPLDIPPMASEDSNGYTVNIPDRVWLPREPAEGQVRRCFAIVKTQPGENPWRLNSTMENFKEVLGDNVWDWWLPFRHSPLRRNRTSRKEGFYRWNEDLLNRLKKEARIGEGFSHE